MLFPFDSTLGKYVQEYIHRSFSDLFLLYLAVKRFRPMLRYWLSLPEHDIPVVYIYFNISIVNMFHTYVS